MVAASANKSDAAMANAALEDALAKTVDSRNVFPALSPSYKGEICAEADVTSPTGHSMDQMVRFGKCSAARQTFDARSHATPIFAAL